MQKLLLHAPFLLLLVLLTAFTLWGLPLVPFHPDESTYLYMSADFETWLTQPTTLAWDPAKEDDPLQQYRERDAPLTRYLLGLGRTLAGLPSLQADWDWAKTWEQNRLDGALPSAGLLLAGRTAAALLLPLSLALVYLAGLRLGGRATGFLAALLLGANALTLLHNRRAMGEAGLTLGVALCIWAFWHGHRRPWLAGLAAGLALAAKHSALALLPVGALAVVWLLPETPRPWRQRGLNLAQYLAAFAVLTLAFNPLLWNRPVEALKASWTSRQALLVRQVADVSRLAPGQVLHSPGQRVAVTLAQVYLLPPSFAETANYLEQTAAAEAAYRATPGHMLLRGSVAGGALLFLTLAGILLALLQIRGAAAEWRRGVYLLLSAFFIQGLGLLVVVPLAWQRYSLPLLPFICLWAAYGARRIVLPGFRLAARKVSRPPGKGEDQHNG